MNLLVRSGRLHLLRPSLRLFLTNTQHPFPFSSSSSSKFSTFNGQTPPPPKPHFSAAQFLVQSCGLSSEEALPASKKIDHLKSPDKPQAVLRFLRDAGIGEPHIRKAVLREPRILRSSVEKNWRPNLMKLQEVGFSIEYISALISRHPVLFTWNIVSKIDFWMRALGSQNLSVVFNRGVTVLCSRNQKIRLNLSFLKEHMGLDFCQILRLIRQAPFLIAGSPKALMIKVKEAEELGVSQSSRIFVRALVVVSNLNQMTIESRLHNLKNLGFSQEDVTTILSKQPSVLTLPEELMTRKVEFLIKKVGCDKLYLVTNPAMLTLSLNKRLIPRNLVHKLLELKGLSVAKRKFSSFALPTEEQFLKRYVLPYEHTIPGLHQAYADTCAGNIRGFEWFENVSS